VRLEIPAVICGGCNAEPSSPAAGNQSLKFKISLMKKFEKFCMNCGYLGNVSAGNSEAEGGAAKP
jgi:hypothetical protein